jgi:hypothetical protein
MEARILSFGSSISVFQGASNDALDALVGRLGETLREYLPRTHFILGLDEAQRASRMYPRSFISSTDTGTFRSIIREIIKVFTMTSIKLIVSGTGLSLADLQDSMTSGVSKRAEVILFYELGMFDTWPKLESFLKRYVPASILYSRSGYRLQLRMREYLQGR